MSGGPGPATGGEEAIIQGHLAALAAGHRGAFGLTDDAASLSPPPGFDIVATMDAIAEGVHFLPGDAAADIGWKALAVNVSDLAGKGAEPQSYLMALSFPQAPDEGWLAGFAKGLEEAQRAFGIVLIGGDTDRRPGPATVTITALGLVPAGRMVRRGTARPGDQIYVSGTLGASAMGLMLRRGDKRAADWPLAAAQRASLEARYLRPEPRLELRTALLSHASAAMDLSDGLMKDLDRMMRASGTAALIDVEQLPVCAAAQSVLEADPDMISAPASGGDDYEILATVAPMASGQFEAAAAEAGIPVARIGVVVERQPERPPVDLRPSATAARLMRVLPRGGYDHFG